jgi:hypothetical protein
MLLALKHHNLTLQPHVIGRPDAKRALFLKLKLKAIPLKQLLAANFQVFHLQKHIPPLINARVDLLPQVDYLDAQQIVLS